MKSFKTILSEVAKDARNDEDKRFKDQHIVQKFDYPVEGSDAIFKGTIDKKPRLADDGSDANYDQAYAKKQTRGKALGEDADLNEISMDLAKKAFYKRKSQAFDAAHRGDREAANKLANKKNKIKAYIQAREEVEQLGEAKLDAFDFEPMDPPKGIDYDDKNLRKVNWKLYDDGAIRDIIKMADTSANERSPHGPNFQATAGRYYQNIIKAAKAELKKRGIKEEVEQIDEVTSSAIKKPVNITGPDGKTRTVMRKARNDRTDDRGQTIMTRREETEKLDEFHAKGMEPKASKKPSPSSTKKSLASIRKKMGESVELSEAIKAGNMKLNDGSSVKISKQDADLINQMMKDLNSKNRKEMQKVMMTDKAGFEEIVGFAREAL